MAPGTASIQTGDVGALAVALADYSIPRIQLAPGTYYVSETLYIERDVIVTAAEAKSTVLNADGKTRVLSITNGHVALSGLSITGGSAENGAGIHICNEWSATDVTIDSCTIRDNAASGAGGGLFMASGNVTLSNCHTHDNSALSGGGLVFGDSSNG